MLASSIANSDLGHKSCLFWIGGVKLLAECADSTSCETSSLGAKGVAHLSAGGGGLFSIWFIFPH